ncbi:hypothetical protein [Actinoplanes sp. GCM10030250]|uniref:hypothetical protein n=1 Tax=Actinoplanes sp. GCM10030250 TaxID=3273376 RepID=UPI003606AEBA
MGVENIRSQAARTDNGVVLRNVDRETMRVEYGGRVMDVQVERGVERSGIYLPPSPTWNDGEVVEEETLVLIKGAIVEIQEYWGFAADFLVLEV